MKRSLLYYEAARERLQSQEALNTEIGSKAIGLSGLGLAILTASAIILRVSDAKLGFGEPVSLGLCWPPPRISGSRVEVYPDRASSLLGTRTKAHHPVRASLNRLH